VPTASRTRLGRYAGCARRVSLLVGMNNEEGGCGSLLRRMSQEQLTEYVNKGKTWCTVMR